MSNADSISSVRVDRSEFSVVSLSEPSDEKAYWLSRTPEERLAALELLRQLNYGYDAATARIEKFFEVVSLK